MRFRSAPQLCFVQVDPSLLSLSLSPGASATRVGRIHGTNEFGQGVGMGGTLLCFFNHDTHSDRGTNSLFWNPSPVDAYIIIPLSPPFFFLARARDRACHETHTCHSLPHRHARGLLLVCVETRASTQRRSSSGFSKRSSATSGNEIRITPERPVIRGQVLRAALATIGRYGAQRRRQTGSGDCCGVDPVIRLEPENVLGRQARGDDEIQTTPEYARSRRSCCTSYVGKYCELRLR